MVKPKNPQSRRLITFPSRIFFYLAAMLTISPVIFAVSFYLQFEKMYQDKIYPGVKVDNIHFGGKTPLEVENYFNDKNKIFEKISIQLKHEDKIATLSANEIKAGFDAKLSATQAYLIGRSGNLLSDLYQKWWAKNGGIKLKSVLTMNESYIDETINYMSFSIDVPATDALFNFSDGKVKVFKPSKNGLILNKEKTKEEIMKYLETVSRSDC